MYYCIFCFYLSLFRCMYYMHICIIVRRCMYMCAYTYRSQRLTLVSSSSETHFVLLWLGLRTQNLPIGQSSELILRIPCLLRTGDFYWAISQTLGIQTLAFTLNTDPSSISPNLVSFFKSWKMLLFYFQICVLLYVALPGCMYVHLVHVQCTKK